MIASTFIYKNKNSLKLKFTQQILTHFVKQLGVLPNECKILNKT